MLAPRIVNDVSCVTRINHGIHFAWQAQYLLRLEVDLLALRIGNDVSYETRTNLLIQFEWQAQYLVNLDCHFSWQAQHLVTFWEIAGARNVVFFNTKSCPRSDE